MDYFKCATAIILIFAIYEVGPAHAQPCPVLNEIPQNQYDRNYSSITLDGKRPLGFTKVTVLYGADESNYPCYQVNGVGNGRMVEIFFETIPESVLCFRDQRNSERCSDTHHQECRMATDSTMQYYFYNDVSKGSSEADITFWLRITVGPPRELDTEYMWCQGRQNSYPESLRRLPDYVQPASTRPSLDGTTSHLPSLILLFTTSVFLGLLINI